MAVTVVSGMVGVERSAGLELSGAGLALPLCDLSIDSVYTDTQHVSTLTITASDSQRVRPWTTLPLPLWDLSIDSVYIDRQPRPSRLLTPTESDHGQPCLGLTAAMRTALFLQLFMISRAAFSALTLLAGQQKGHPACK